MCIKTVEIKEQTHTGAYARGINKIRLKFPLKIAAAQKGLAIQKQQWIRNENQREKQGKTQKNAVTALPKVKRIATAKTTRGAHPHVQDECDD